MDEYVDGFHSDFSNGNNSDVIVAATPRPIVLPVNEEGIPSELKQLPQWVFWKYQRKPDNEKWTKVPCNPVTGRFAKTNDSSTWGTYEEATSAWKSRDGDGIGFVFTLNDPYVGVDLDDCRNAETGHIFTQALQLIGTFASYTEISPSGTGVKIIVRGRLPGDGNKNGPLEMYDHLRYFALTGQVLEGTCATIGELTTSGLDLYQKWLGREEKRQRSSRLVEEFDRTDTENTNGRELWERVAPGLKRYHRDLAAGRNANWQGKAYSSESDADMALLCGLGDAGLDEDEVVLAFFATRRGEMAVERYGEADAYRRIERSAKKAVGNGEQPEGEERPANISPIRPHVSNPTDTKEHLPERRPRFMLITGEAIFDQPHPTFLIGGILVENTLSAMIGKEATFKSFISLDMALSVATGTPFQGHTVLQGNVIYVAGEGGGGMTKRIEAWTRHHDCHLPETFHLLPEAVHLIERGQVADFMESIETLPENPKLIVVDTLARAMQGGDENSAKDMGLLIAACDSLRTRFGAHVLLVHHENKKGGVRGSTSLPGAIDTRIDIDRNGELVTLTCSKQKDDDTFADITLKRQIIELAENASSLVLTKTDKQTANATGTTEKVLAILAEYFDEKGATATDWEKMCKTQGIASSVFYPAKKELVNQERVGTAGRVGQRGAHFTVTGRGGE